MTIRQGCVIYPTPRKVERIRIKQKRRRRRRRPSTGISDEGLNQASASQAECGFLNRLSLELRLLVYREVINSWAFSERVHIVETRSCEERRPMSHISCKFPIDGNVDQAVSEDRPDQYHFQTRHGECFAEHYQTPNKPIEPNGTSLSFFQSCRTM